MKIVIWNVQLIKLNEADTSIKTFLNEPLIQNMGELFFTEQKIRFIRLEGEIFIKTWAQFLFSNVLKLLMKLDRLTVYSRRCFFYSFFQFTISTLKISSMKNSLWFENNGISESARMDIWTKWVGFGEFSRKLIQALSIEWTMPCVFW